MNKNVDIYADFINCLNEYKRLDIESAIDYEKFNKFLISHHSTSIEGSSLTYEDTQLLLNDGLTPKGKPLKDIDMVRDHQRALEYIIAASKKQKITSELIRQIAGMVMKNTGTPYSCIAGNFDSSKGDYRLLSVYIGDTYFMSCQKVPSAVDALCDEINTRLKDNMSVTDVYDLAFDAHIKLVSIHPFADGNGRTSRLLMNYILSACNLPLAVCFTEDRQEYYKALHTIQQSEDKNTESFRKFMYTQQIKFLKTEIAKYIKSQG
ncbi:MAG: Fic family protein [Bacteroidales bacterium]|jgi:Fic family protein|nr:Fic family protein [Bacteroidales bacterium]